MDACGYQWIGIGAYGGSWILMDGYACLQMLVDR